MSDIERISLTGRLGRDPEMKYTQEGKAFTKFSMAVARWDSATKAEVPDWYNITIFGQQAEYINEYAHKGSKVAVTGDLQLRKYVREDKSEALSVDVLADKVVLMDPKPAGDGEGAPATIRPAYPPRGRAVAAADDEVEFGNVPF